MNDIWFGLGGSLLIAGAAYWKRSLSLSGLIAAVALGTAMFTLGSPAWFGTLIAFFITSSLLSAWKRRAKAAAESGYAKTGRRDAGQVLANGGLGLLLCAVHAIAPHPYVWAAFIGVMATVTADTWATEIGGLSRTKPRSIVTGSMVEPGTSGGITMLGLAATAAGALFIGLIAWWLGLLPISLGGEEPARLSVVTLALIGFAGGFAGSLIDSWLGATVQTMYRCAVCGKEMEKSRHCEAAAQRIRGLTWMSNDIVNLLSSVAGGAVSLLLAAML